uniref:Uncharacterized protein n=1 Tax=Hippocampus comes TaxID=109280 RepID=A0A3Q3E6C1_HIPCM
LAAPAFCSAVLVARPWTFILGHLVSPGCHVAKVYAFVFLGLRSLETKEPKKKAFQKCGEGKRMTEGGRDNDKVNGWFKKYNGLISCFNCVVLWI